MSGRRGYPRPGSGYYRPSGPYRPPGSESPSGPHRPGRPGGNDNVVPLITGMLGSSILAFSLYVFSQKNGMLGENVQEAGPDVPSVESVGAQQPIGAQEPRVAPEPAIAQPAGAQEPVVAQKPVPYAQQENDYPKISIEKRRWLTDEEEEILRELRANKGYKGNLEKQLSKHLQKVKEIREQLAQDDKGNKKEKCPCD